MRLVVGNGVVYCDRVESGLPVPHNNDGVTTRPLLKNGIGILTDHYPGSSATYKNMDGPVKKKIYINEVQRQAMARPPATRNSFEYNYFIFMDGEVWEYAGEYLAAHSAGENPIAYGVQFVNGNDDLCTDIQVLAYQWLRDVHLKLRGKVSSNAVSIPHREMPGAATLCPGDRAIMPRMNDLRKPYLSNPIQPVESEMTYLIQDTTGVYSTGDFVSYRAVSPSDIDFFIYHSLVQKNGDGSARVIAITDHRDRMIDQSPAAVGNRMAWIVNSVLNGIPDGAGITPEQIQLIINGVVAKMPKSASFTLT